MVVGMCGHATSEMVKEFPELTRVPGIVYFPFGSSEHWWCEDEEGNIIDPTASQFRGTLSYRVVLIIEEVCLGKCMNCGSEIRGPMLVGRQTFCLPMEFSDAYHSFMYEGGKFPILDKPETYDSVSGTSECERSFCEWQEGM